MVVTIISACADQPATQLERIITAEIPLLFNMNGMYVRVTYTMQHEGDIYTINTNLLTSNKLSYYLRIEQMELRRQCCAEIVFVSSFHTHLGFPRHILLDVPGVGCKGRSGRHLRSGKGQQQLYQQQ